MLQTVAACQRDWRRTHRLRIDRHRQSTPSSLVDNDRRVSQRLAVNATSRHRLQSLPPRQRRPTTTHSLPTPTSHTAARRHARPHLPRHCNEYSSPHSTARPTPDKSPLGQSADDPTTVITATFARFISRLQLQAYNLPKRIKVKSTIQETVQLATLSSIKVTVYLQILQFIVFRHLHGTLNTA